MASYLDILDINAMALHPHGAIVAAMGAVMRQGIVSGEGLDGRALEMAQAIIDSDGDLFTDGECLDLLGLLVDQWRAIDLNGGE